MKVIILDSGVLINLSLNGLLYIIPELKKVSDVKFLTTKDVSYETIERPLNVPRFELGALSIKQLLDNGGVELPESIKISDKEINKLKEELMNKANHTIRANGKWMKIVSDAEMSCLALSKILSEKGVDNIIAMDERTTRTLSENSEQLRELISKRLRQNVQVSSDNFSAFDRFRFIRSTELVYVAYKKGVINLSGQKVLEAALYATKYKGSSVSFEEIEELKRL